MEAGGDCEWNYEGLWQGRRATVFLGIVRVERTSFWLLLSSCIWEYSSHVDYRHLSLYKNSILLKFITKLYFLIKNHQWVFIKFTK